jgi:hypothetical protein
MSGDPVCVRRAKSVEEAEIIVAWLDEEGIEATIVDPSNPGVLAFGVTDVEGIAVYVRDAETAERAAALLAEHDRRHDESGSEEASRERIQQECPECGQNVEFDAELGGTVQECPECGANVDVRSFPR